MDTKRLLIFLAIIIILIDLAYFYPKLTGEAIYELRTANVTKVIDGDTIETDIGKVRFLGINTPEKKMPYYNEAKSYLEEFLGKTVEIEVYGEDKYKRILGYVFYNDKLINKEILEKGLGSLYVYEKDRHYSDLKKAEQEAREQEKGIWKKSENYGCIELINLKYTEEDRCNNQEQMIFNNRCSTLNLTLKDDANHIYKISIEKGIFMQNFSCIFNDEGDSLFLRDDEGLLLYYNY